MPPPVVITVPARAALAGNPSDLYGGAVLAVPIPSLHARVEIADAPATRVGGPADGRALIDAAMARGAPTDQPIAVTWSTDIPRSVGLAGSSAIVIATLRALAVRAGAPVDDLALAELALEVEVDGLGIVAGLQDRVVQSFGRPVLVDVSGAAPAVTLLAPAQPLRIMVAWLGAAAADSGPYHRDLRERTKPDGGLMRELGDVARSAATAFAAGDAPGLSTLMAESARVRAHAAPLSAAHERLAAALTDAGMRPNSAGSGGAVVAVVLDDDALDRAAAAVTAIGGGLIVET